MIGTYKRETISLCIPLVKYFSAKKMTVKYCLGDGFQGVTTSG
jgi:hypothetical protein